MIKLLFRIRLKLYRSTTLVPCLWGFCKVATWLSASLVYSLGRLGHNCYTFANLLSLFSVLLTVCMTPTTTCVQCRRKDFEPPFLPTGSSLSKRRDYFSRIWDRMIPIKWSNSFFLSYRHCVTLLQAFSWLILLTVYQPVVLPNGLIQLINLFRIYETPLR